MTRTPRTPNQTTTSRTVGHNLRQLRTTRGWSLHALSALTHTTGHRISYHALQCIETGHHTNPARSPRAVSVDELITLARTFDIEPTELLTPAHSDNRQATA